MPLHTPIAGRNGELFEAASRPSAVPPQPTLAAAQARLAAAQPAAYARTRNALEGATTGLSPYITHGFLSLREVLATLDARQPLHVQHKLVYELGWRSYFRHVWAHRGEAILHSLHEGPLPEAAYATTLPADIREGRTGVPAIDQAVRTLYATGLLHNHARMWLASYVVHLRKIHWRAGADWLYGHLLDGDLASNHLSWQWVAGTGSHKPYLFNAENVARYAPPAWHSPGTVVDTSYEALDAMARDARAFGTDSILQQGGVAEPALAAQPPAWLGACAPDAAAVRGRDVWLVHPWSLGELPTGLPASHTAPNTAPHTAPPATPDTDPHFTPRPADLPPDALVIGLFASDFHAAWPWSEARWRFAGERVAALAPWRWWGDASACAQALAQARSVRAVADAHIVPHLSAASIDWLAEPELFPAVDRPCASFSQWWSRVTRGMRMASELLAPGLPATEEPAAGMASGSSTVRR